MKPSLSTMKMGSRKTRRIVSFNSRARQLAMNASALLSILGPLSKTKPPMLNQPSQTMPNVVRAKARTVLLDWYALDGRHIGSGSYLTTCKSIEAICQEIDRFAFKGKRLGIALRKQDKRGEFVSITVLSEGYAHPEGAEPKPIPLDPDFARFLHVATLSRQ